MAVLGIHFTNCVAVLVASVLGQFISFMWFSTIFVKPWIKYSNWDKELLKKQKPGLQPILYSYLEQLITFTAIVILTHYLGINTIPDALKLTVFVWFGFMATVAINEVIWHAEKIQFYLINQGCYLVRNSAMIALYGLIVF